MLPVIAIVGRPNVGKSTLFNRMVGARQALVDDRPGVTRDRNYATTEHEGREIAIVDTGGFEPDLAALAEGDLFRAVRAQAEAAIDEADCILFLVDRQAGLTPADKLTAEILRRRAGPQGESRIVLVVNKCDGPMHDIEANEFFELGIEPLLSISAEHGRGMFELWEAVDARLPAPREGEDEPGEDDQEIRVAVIGKPNIGKSTLVNRLIGEERHVVHDMPGTTMDSVDSVIRVGDRTWRFVDTAGVRRKTRIDDQLESRATLHAIRTIERCHVSLLMVDGLTGVSNQDARLASLVIDRGRACIILVNRWDLVREDPERNVRVVQDEIARELPHLTWAPQLFVSALTGKGCHRILPLIEEVFARFDTRVPTARLNRFLEDAVAANPPPQKHHHRVRLNYMTQARVRPPTFVVWSNSPDAVKPPYLRFLENQLRQAFGFEGSPIRLHVRRKRKPGEARRGGAEEGDDLP